MKTLPRWRNEWSLPWMMISSSVLTFGALAKDVRKAYLPILERF